MMMLIIFPNISKQRRDKKRFCEELEFSFKEIRTLCYDVFKENTIKKREAFFTEPLIKYLWNFFINIKPEISVNYLRRVRSFPYEGEARFKKLTNDIYEFEKQFDVKILPDEARDEKAIIPFGSEDQHSHGDKNDESNDLERENDGLEGIEEVNTSVELYLKELANDKTNEEELLKILDDIPGRPSAPLGD